MPTTGYPRLSAIILDSKEIGLLLDNPSTAGLRSCLLVTFRQLAAMRDCPV
jgi:hypothetical protein